MAGVIAILGGTGPEGFGLALRWTRAGETVIIGSRDPARAREAAAKIRAAVGSKAKISTFLCLPSRLKATALCSSKSSRQSRKAAS
jgi:predicted dinucleotide-binding enzyme